MILTAGPVCRLANDYISIHRADEQHITKPQHITVGTIKTIQRSTRNSIIGVKTHIWEATIKNWKLSCFLRFTAVWNVWKITSNLRENWRCNLNDISTSVKRRKITFNSYNNFSCYSFFLIMFHQLITFRTFRLRRALWRVRRRRHLKKQDGDEIALDSWLVWLLLIQGQNFL